MPLTRFFLDRPRLVVLVTILLGVVGILSVLKTKRATYPNVDFDIIKITTIYPGASAQDIEIKVTNKLEEELRQIADIEKIQSSSIENTSLIYVFIDTNSDQIKRVKDEIQQAVLRVNNLPSEITERPRVEELRSTNVAIIEVAVMGSAPEADLRKTAKDLKNEILEISGVSTIEMVGYRAREVTILVDADKLTKNYLSLTDITQAVNSRNIRLSAGDLELSPKEKKVVYFSEFENPKDVENVFIRHNDAAYGMRLGEIAQVKEGFKKEQVISRTDGAPSINLLVRSQAKSDIIDISSDVQKLIQDFQKRLPAHVELRIVSDFSRYTEIGLNILRNNGVIGFGIVLLVLFLFLNRYVALWTALGIPLSIFGAFIFFPLFGVDLNFIVLITLILVLGMLVDDAIVIAEKISFYREQGMEPREASIKGVKAVFWPVCGTVVSTIIAFIPIFFMKGITGKFVVEIPIVVILTLGLSLLESTLILPSHIAQSPRTRFNGARNINKIRIFYEKIARLAIHHRLRTLIVFGFFLIGAFILLTTSMKLVLFPYDDVDINYVLAELPEGVSLETTAKKMKEVEALVDRISRDEMTHYTTRIGHHDTNVYGASGGLHTHWALITLFFKPPGERDRTSEEIMASLDSKLKNLKGFTRLYVDKYNDGPPIGRPITVTVVSDNDKDRRLLASQMMDFLKDKKGVLALEMDERNGKEELRIIPHFKSLARAGVSSYDVAHVLRAAYEGLDATEITKDSDEVAFRVRLKEKDRQNPSLLKELLVPNARGARVELEKLVDLVPYASFENVEHYNGQRSITLTGDVDPAYLTSHQINQQIRERFDLMARETPGLRLIFGGEEKATQESMESFYAAFLVALLAIYCLLVVLLGSYRLPMIIMSVIPFGLAGVVLAFFVHGQPISFLGMIGALGLIGVLVNDSLVMVSHLNEVKKEKGVLTRNLIIMGAKDRLRPVLLTTITTVLGLAPTIYGIGGTEPFIVPVVLAVAGGLLFATPVTLILVPLLYSFMEVREDHTYSVQ